MAAVLTFCDVVHCVCAHSSQMKPLSSRLCAHTVTHHTVHSAHNTQQRTERGVSLTWLDAITCTISRLTAANVRSLALCRALNWSRFVCTPPFFFCVHQTPIKYLENRSVFTVLLSWTLVGTQYECILCILTILWDHFVWVLFCFVVFFRLIGFILQLRRQLVFLSRHFKLCQNKFLCYCFATTLHDVTVTYLVTPSGSQY